MAVVPTFAKYGGKDNYVASQNNRWQAANESNDQDLMSRLLADSKRANYTLNPFNSSQSGNQMTGQDRSNNLMTQLEQALSKPFEMPTFSFNPETDQRYIQSMKLADQAAEQGTGNVLANLASRGIENGSIMGDRAAQIQQQERAKVSGQLVPQLYAQAYDQFANELNMNYRANQDQLSGLASLLGRQDSQNQLGLDNLFRDKSFNWEQGVDKRNFDRGVLESNRGFNRGVLESDRGFDRGVLESDRNYDRGILESDRAYNLDRSRESRISSGGGGGGGSGGGSSAKPANLNTVISNINSLYTQYADGKRTITDPKAIKAYIDSMGLPDAQRSQLYNYYSINAAYSNAGDFIKDLVSGAWGKLTGKDGEQKVEDDEIRQYLK
jgi:hypothetical protein